MLSDSESRNWAMAAHLSALSGYVIPFGSILGPLVVWLIKKDESSYVDAQGKEALNFQITMAIYFIIGVVLLLVAIGILIIIAVAIFDLIMVIIASIKAANGEEFRYPVTLRLIH